jgi:cell pole-organizing protein PopZ
MAENKIDSGEENTAQGGDINNILQGIKDIVENGESGHDSSVLVLTDKVVEPGADILEEIDKGASVKPQDSKEEAKPQHEEGLVSASVGAAVNASISQLLAPQNITPPVVADNRSVASQSVEGLVTTLLKKELSAWLNSNLDNLVREIVEKEIKKIVK